MAVKKKYLGIIYIILSAFSFAFMFAFVRMAGDLPTMQKTFFRNFVALWFAIGVMVKNRIPLRVEGHKPRFALFIRCLAGSLGMIGNFYAIDHLKLSDASMLNKMSPFFAVVFSIIVVKEKLTLVQLLTILGAFGGSLFIIKPSFSNRRQAKTPAFHNACCSSMYFRAVSSMAVSALRKYSSMIPLSSTVVPP